MQSLDTKLVSLHKCDYIDTLTHNVIKWNCLLSWTERIPVVGQALNVQKNRSQMCAHVLRRRNFICQWHAQ